MQTVIVIYVVILFLLQVVIYSNDSVSILNVHGVDNGSEMDEDVHDENPLLQQTSHRGEEDEETDKVHTRAVHLQVVPSICFFFQGLRFAQQSSICRSLTNQIKKYAILFTNGAWKETLLLICIW